VVQGSGRKSTDGLVETCTDPGDLRETSDLDFPVPPSAERRVQVAHVSFHRKRRQGELT
jgi:hypothetical protein